MMTGILGTVKKALGKTKAATPSYSYTSPETGRQLKTGTIDAPVKNIKTAEKKLRKIGFKRVKTYTDARGMKTVVMRKGKRKLYLYLI